MLDIPWLSLMPVLLLAACFLVLLASPWWAAGSCLRLAGGLLTVSMGLAGGLGMVEWHALPPLAGLYCLAWFASHSTTSWCRYPALLATLVTAFLVATHQLGGFHSQHWLDGVPLGGSGPPFTLAAPLDKPWVGAVLLLAFAPHSRGQVPFTQGVIWSLGGATLIILAGWSAGVPVEPKWNMNILVFLFHNLFLTCIAEEAFFRLLLQAPLQALGT